MNKTHEFCPADRYKYDFMLTTSKGFAQIDTDQDASYFGTWANPFKLIIFNYVEGDCYTTECESTNEFVNEINLINQWNIEQGYKQIGIDPGFDNKLKAKFNEIGLNKLIH